MLCLPRSITHALLSVGFAVTTGAFAVSVVVGAARPGQDAPPAPAAPAEDPARLFHRLCSDCHDTDRIVAPRRTKLEWEEQIREMIVEGATGSDEEFRRVLEYLLLTYGKVAGVAVVGNEDGAHHVTAELYQALGDVGFTVPANGVTYWVGEAMQATDYKDKITFTCVP